ncbi:unnamed protein product [Orchesella dallaii]|uniref:Uncharacterized protein n=1 Tax=Orchesella dallaii TaxID=48710 RepID=A0ABP1QJH5_9HEXA
MRFICDICPLTATTGQTVIIGHYEAWIKHLLTPQHQTEQNLAMKRRSCWTEAGYTAMVKNLPKFDESSADLYEDVAMQLSEYGFIEAIFHRKLTESESIYVAIQLYETKPFPSNLAFIDGNEFSVTLLPKPTMNSLSGNGFINDGSGLGQRRRRLSSTSSGGHDSSFLMNLSISGNENGAQHPRSPSTPMTPSPSNTWSSPVSRFFSNGRESRPLEKKDFSTQCDLQSSNTGCNTTIPLTLTTMMISNGKVKNMQTEKYMGRRGTRIKYDKDTLLLFCGTKTLPRRFFNILNFPMEIMLKDAKIIDPEQLRMEADFVWEEQKGNGNDFRRQWRKPNEETGGWTNPMNSNNSWHKTQY